MLAQQISLLLDNGASVLLTHFKKKMQRVFNPLMAVHYTEERPLLLKVQLYSHTPHVAKNKVRCAEQRMPFL